MANEKVPNKNLFDMVEGFFKGVPLALLEERRTLEYALRDNDIVTAYKVQTPESLKLLGEKYKGAKTTDKNKNILQNMKMLNDMNDAYAHLASLKTSRNEDEIKRAASKAIEIARGYQSFPAFEVITADAENPAMLKTKILLAEKNYRDKFLAMGSPGQGDVYVYNSGAKYGMQAIEGLAKLGRLDDCKDALRGQRATYGAGGDGLEYISWAVEKLADPAPGNILLATAAFQLAGAQGITIEQLPVMLKHCPDDSLKTKLIEQVMADRFSGDPDQRIAKDQQIVTLLIDHLKTENGVSAPSQQKALDILIKDFSIMSPGYGGSVPFGAGEFYKTVFDEIPKANAVVLGLLGDAGKMEAFVDSYNRFKYDSERERVEIGLTDLIPGELKGPLVMKARNDLAGKLFDSALEDYQDRGSPGAPSERTSTRMSAAVSFTSRVISDESLEAGSPEKTRAMWVLRETVLAQRVKRVKAEEDYQDAVSRSKGQPYYSAKEDNEKLAATQHAEKMKGLDSGGMAVEFLANSEKTRDMGLQIREEINRQAARITVLKPKSQKAIAAPPA